jgi:NitT/TauT family transport system substrate-binding protein
LIEVSSGPQAVSAMVAGQADVCEMGASTAISSIVQGSELKILAALHNDLLYSFVVTPAIQKAADLKGKSVAVTKLGSSQDMAIRLALARLGLTPDQETKVLAIGDDAARLAAMEAGQLAGSLVTLPVPAALTEKGYHELLDLQSLGMPYLRTALVAPRSFIKDQRPALTAFMKAVVETIHQMKQDRAGTREVLAKYLLLDTVKDAAQLDATYDLIILKYLANIPNPSMTGAQTVMDEIKADNPKVLDFKPTDFFDLSLLEELKANGFLAPYQ